MKLVSPYSTIKMIHGPINIRLSDLLRYINLVLWQHVDVLPQREVIH